jgi:hypothetical protein
MMEAVSMSETSVNFYETTRRNMPEESHLHITIVFFHGHQVMSSIREVFHPKRQVLASAPELS